MDGLPVGLSQDVDLGASRCNSDQPGASVFGDGRAGS